MHPEGKQLPTESDFCASSRSLDEWHAVKMFLGKTAGQAEVMFRENFLFYQEDLTYMRAVAFRFYVLPAIHYLCSDAANGDSDAVNTFCHVLEARLAGDPQALCPIKAAVVNAIQNILSNFDRFDCDPEIYEDVPARYQALLAQLEA